MHFNLAQVLLALPAFAGAVAVPAVTAERAIAPLNETLSEGPSLDKRHNAPPHPCNVNSRSRDLWVEYGRSRWRTAFSASGIDPATFYQY
ncbi:hypothetical protein B0T16DRAFT_455608 [Cercophora newfieldiana]|uniref:Uncharacterized protein n=1 Tax=Cercophora newfieldiana TaxID=92897 RepID=A0AA39YBP7_9PEZI|nr:hypothetical protein B0T16DRAFT_455608 [Cercophora newfieldiana]